MEEHSKLTGWALYPPWDLVMVVRLQMEEVMVAKVEIGMEMEKQALPTVP